jgi:hypothetical protein
MTILTQTEQRQKSTEGLIMLRVRAGFTVITRKDLSKDYVNQLTFLGAAPQGMGFETSAVMAEIAPQIGYEFKHDGLNLGGRYINPRIEKKQPLSFDILFSVV